MKIILASGSPRRHYLLKMINLNHEVFPSSVDEIFDPALSPADVAMQLATQKAGDVARHHRNTLVIGADTVVVLDGVLLGKPKDGTEAELMLRTLSSRTHEVITGVALIDTSETIERVNMFYESTLVTFADLEDAEIKAYVATGSPLDKAGSYGIQDDLGCLFVTDIRGDYYNVVGLPVSRLYRQLMSFKPEIARKLLIER